MSSLWPKKHFVEDSDPRQSRDSSQWPAWQECRGIAGAAVLWRAGAIACFAFAIVALVAPASAKNVWQERQLTFDARNHDLDNNDNFSPDNLWLVYDTRSDALGISANGIIEKVHIETREQVVVHREPRQQQWGPGVGAASFHPTDGSVVIMRGLSSSTETRPYGFSRRTSVRIGAADEMRLLDGRDVTAPWTPGALRGGTHRPEWSADGQWIGFTYEDAVLTELERMTGKKVNLRTFGVAATWPQPVKVHSGPENHDGSMFAVIIGRVSPDPRPGSDEIKKAFEDAWIGRNGYRRPDGQWQKRARAFLGTLITTSGREITEVFVADIPDRIDMPGEYGPLEGAAETMPAPPKGVQQRRLTFTENRKYPGVALLPRHWLRSSPDGEWIVYLAQDDAGIVQAFIVNPRTSEVKQVTQHESSIQSCARWSPDGSSLLYVQGGSVTICAAEPTATDFGTAHAITAPSDPVPEAPVWSNHGKHIAFNRRVLTEGIWYKQIFLLSHAGEQAGGG